MNHENLIFAKKITLVITFLALSIFSSNLSAKNSNILARGFITVETHTGQKKQKTIYLPNIKVYLQPLIKQAPPTTGVLLKPKTIKTESLIPNDFKIKPADLLLKNTHNLSDLLLSNVKKNSVKTDLSGRFTLRTKRISRYRVCWEASGYISGCTKEIIPAKPNNLYLGNIKIRVDTKKIHLGSRSIALTSPLYGDVRLQDKSLARAFDPLANINVFPTVTIEDKEKKVLYSAFVNNHGQYFIPQVPLQGSVVLKAKIESAETVIPLNSGGAVTSFKLKPIDITLRNKRPRLDALVAQNALGRRIKVAQIGSKIFLRAKGKDADNDSLNYKWVISKGSGSLSTLDHQETIWELPTSPGRYSVKVYAYDKKGGYASSKLSIKTNKETGDNNIIFSGYVSGTDVSAIKKAEITINGQTTLTNSQGFFRTHVKDADRFVLNIRKPGYSLVSDIYDDSVIGGHWRLTRASVESVDPSKEVIVTNKRKSGDCPPPASSRINWSRYPKLITQPEWQDGKGNFIHRPKMTREENRILKRSKSVLFGTSNPKKSKDKQNSEQSCGAGISVRIPPNSLVDKNGNPPPGLVKVQLSTINLSSPEQMPGDYSAETLSGDIQVMRSYGAGEIKIYDNSKEYNLKAGSTAEIAIPVDPMQKSAPGALPPEIPFLFYDEPKGMWKEMGKAQLTFNGSNPGYIGKTTHFTPFNADTLKSDQACVRIQSSALGGNFNKMELIVPLGNDAPRIITREMDNSAPSEHVVYNLPTDTNIVLVALHDADLTDPNNENTPLGTYVVNTGGQQNPTSPNLPAGPPYNACSTEVVMNTQTIPVSPGGDDAFLQGLFSFDAINQTELLGSDPTQDVNDPTTLAGGIRQATLNYYQQIDPRGKRATLEGAINSFVSTNNMGTGAIRAPFANSGDLGFGRDMQCKRNWVDDDADGVEEANEYDVACHVTNYGDHLTADIDDAVAAASQTTENLSNRIATVAMEYSRVESPLGSPVEFDDPERVVKFYVYNADGSALLADADLDGFGARPIPQLCMVCHGGVFPAGNTVGAGNPPSFNSRNDIKLGSRFIPFDIFFYTFAGDATDPTDLFNKDNLQDEFEALNKEIVMATIPPSVIGTDPIEEVIDNMYPVANDDQVDDFVVSGWNNSGLERQMYSDVVAKACRACHIASPFDGSNPSYPINLRFNEASQVNSILGSVESRVCSDFVMPHAKRTYDIFWGSNNPHMPGILQIYGDAQSPANGWSGDLCGDFTPGQGTPESFYSLNIQPIWDGSAFANISCAGAGCHIGGVQAGLDLSGSAIGPDPSYGNIVNISSTQEPALDRIEPGNLTNSYLHQKLLGTQGNGTSNMPLGGFPIDPAALTIIDIWINSGAPGP